MFTGIPKAAATFYDELEANNTREWWQAHKDDYESQVKGPMLALLGELPADYQPFHVYRPNRDVRFSKDKSPYKTFFGAFHEGDGAGGSYLRLAADGILVGGGMFGMMPDQLERFRAAVDDADIGAELTRLIDQLTAAGLEVDGGGDEALKNVPRGFAKDHPRAHLLKWKGIAASRQFEPATAFDNASIVEPITAALRATDALNAWLNTHVGTTTTSDPRAH